MYKKNLIVAMDENRFIGKDGKLPLWKLSADMEHFKKITVEAKIVIMGRKKFESIPEKFRPLKERVNVILTKNKEFKAPGCLVLHSVEHALKIFKDVKFYVIGGGKIYQAFLPHICRLVVTHVKTKIEGDTFFPEIDSEWRSHTILEHQIDEKNQYPFSIVEYTRRPRT